MATETPIDPKQAAYVDLAIKTVLDSIAQATADKRHGRDEIHITYFAGEIRQIEYVPRTTLKL